MHKALNPKSELWGIRQWKKRRQTEES